jgi:hypothetical protein
MKILQVVDVDSYVASESFNEVVPFDDLFFEFGYLTLEVDIFFNERIVLFLQTVKDLSQLGKGQSHSGCWPSHANLNLLAISCPIFPESEVIFFSVIG